MRFISSFGIFVVALIWAAAFVFLSLNVQDVRQGFSLLIIGTISSFVLAYWSRLIYRSHRLDQRFRFLQQGISSLAPNIESVMFDNSGRVIWTTHPNTYPTQQEFFRKLLARISDPAQVKQIQDIFEGRQRGEVLFSGGGNGLGQDQKWWLFTQSTFERNSRVVIVRDVTQHFDAYAQIKQQYKLLEDFIDKAPLGIYYTSRNGTILGVNSTLCQWLDLSKDQMIGRPISDFIKDTESYRGVVRVFNKLGPTFKAILFKSDSTAQSKSRPSILCRLDNVTGIPANEIAQDNTYLDAVIPAVIVNNVGDITSCNSAFSLMLGDLGNPNNLLELIVPAFRSDVEAKLKRAFEQRSAITPFEIRFEGERIQTTAYASRPWLRSQQQEMMLQFIDISEQKRLEGQFIQSQKMQAVGQLAGGIAHDFNNLLTAMIGYCDLLLQRYLPNDPSYNDVIQIKQNANRAANLVRQLLAFSRRQTLQPKVVNVTDHLVELSTLLRRLIGAGIDLKMIHGRDLWVVKVDVSQLEQVIINLVVNARDAMKDGGALTIRTSNLQFLKQQRFGHDLITKGDYVAIEVIDDGHGIAPEHLEFIFEPFFSTKEIGEGTGLGLSTVYGIVKQTGGYVLVDSKVDEGTIFKILLPKYTGTIETEQAKSEPLLRDLTGGGTILLVEDEDAVRMFSARALREKGYKVIEANNGDAALDIVMKGTHFDLLVTDVVMPKMDGPTLSKKVRDIYPETKTIFISGYTEDTFRKNLDHDAKIHFLPKPFTLKDLASKVKEVLTVNIEQS